MKYKFHIPFYLICCSLLWLISCNLNDAETPEKVYKVYLDNTKNEEIDVFINGQKNKIKANHLEVLELEPGEYHFKALQLNEKKLFEENIKIDTAILINIGHAEYWIAYEVYGADTKAWGKIQLDTTEINGIEVIGKFEKLDAEKHYFKQKWDRQIDEQFLDTLEIHGDYQLSSKLFRKIDYLNYYIGK